jgi:NAD(P)-dependent dehydrogenase (short-subunit alcohol dehydrogenase family)
MQDSDTKKTIVIGGISGGIGSAMATSLQKQGHSLAGYARSAEKLDALATNLPGTTTKVLDATSPDQVDAFIADVIQSNGRIDAYVHAIGSILIKPAHLTSPENWAQTLQTNLSSAFYALSAVVKHMQKQPGGGSCLFFSTAAAQTGIANHEAIAAAKGGIEAMVRSAAATYAPRGIRINAIAPSLTDTPLARPIISSEKALEISKRMHPLGNIAQSGDVASLANWLLSDEAQFVTGQVFVIDGGLSTIVPKPRA